MPDGRKTFLSANGIAYAQDGQEIDPALAKGIDWSDRPTWEDHQVQTGRVGKIEGIARENDGLINRIGGIQDGLDDDNRPALNDLERFDKDLGAIQTEIDGLNTRLNEFETKAPSTGIDHDVSVEAIPSL